MGFLSRLLGFTTKEEVAGAKLDDPKPWVIPPNRDASVVLRALPNLFPTGCFVYFEGTTESSFAAWLEAHTLPAQLKIACGTIWPKSDCYHVPLEPGLLVEAANIVDHEGIALPSIHLCVHNGKQVLLEWYDAFCDDPINVASSIPRDRVEAFARALGVSIRR